MSIFSGWRRKSNDDATLALLRSIYGWGREVAGVTVTFELALRTAAFLACCRVISEGCAQVPCELFRMSPDGNRVKALDDPRYDLLKNEPNPLQDSFQFMEQMVFLAAATGNSYAYKYGPGGNVNQLLPMDRVAASVTRDTDGEAVYQFTMPDGSSKTLGANRVFHLKGPAIRTYVGLDVITLAANALGLSHVLERGQQDLQAKGLQTPGAYAVEGTLNDVQHAQIAKWIAQWSPGGSKAGTPFVIDRNAKWLSMAMSGVDAETLASRKFQIEEICRVMRVQPIMIMQSDKAATFASAEQMFLAHVVHTLMPWYERIERALDRQVLTAKDRGAGLGFDLDETSLLRGALKDTADYWVKLVTFGIATRNDARRALKFNTIAGLDEPLIPTTSPPLDLFPDPNKETPPAKSDTGDTNDE